jgi:hypothetical protein
MLWERIEKFEPEQKTKTIHQNGFCVNEFTCTGRKAQASFFLNLLPMKPGF